MCHRSIARSAWHLVTNVYHSLNARHVLVPTCIAMGRVLFNVRSAKYHI